MKLLLSDIAGITHGSLSGVDAEVSSYVIDSRKAVTGALFAALPGDHSDGHQHVGDALARGAAAALVTRFVDENLPQLRVADTQKALSEMAAAVRDRLSARVVGITGSNGKTTVKTLLAAILARHAKTHANEGNFNNELGLPLSLLATPADAQYAVFEMGAGKPGDIAWLAAMAKPQIGLVNNIAPAHLERMKSLQGIAETKGALYEALPADGCAVINADDEFSEAFAVRAAPRKILRFGLNAEADISARDIVLRGGGSHFVLCTPQGEAVVELGLPGRHNVVNALAAAAVACALAVPLDKVVDGLVNAETVAGRLQVRSMPGGWQLIDDSYNANPASVGAAVDMLAGLAGEAWLVLGDMGELGPDARRLHAECGAMARERGVQRLWTLGKLTPAASEAFGPGGVHFHDPKSLAAALIGDLHAGVNCLIKGSRAAGMERVVQLLRADAHWGNCHVA